MDIFPELINTENQTAIKIHCNEFSIGRSLSCNHTVEHMGVSRSHCIIKKTGDKWFLYDRSTNGTSVNGKQYKHNEFTELKHGDIINLAPNTPKYVFRQFSKDPPSDQNHPSAERQDSLQNNILQVSLQEDIASFAGELNEPFLPDCPPAVSEEIVVAQSSVRPDRKTRDSRRDRTSRNPPSVEPVPGSSELNIVECPPAVSEEIVVSQDCLEQGTVKDGSASVKVPIADEQVPGPSTASAPKMPGTDIMENELTCSICSELFIKAVTLNCSHTFCKFCIDEWRRTKSQCPICRQDVKNVAPTIVLDNFIDKYLEGQPEEVRTVRKELIVQRQESTANRATTSRTGTNHSTGAAGVATGGATTRSGAQYNSSNTGNDGAVIHLSSDTDEDELGEEEEEEEDDYRGMRDRHYYTDEDEDEYDDDYDGYEYNGRPGVYYGGYGRCYHCGQSGHWANGCPNRGYRRT